MPPFRRLCFLIVPQIDLGSESVREWNLPLESTREFPLPCQRFDLEFLIRGESFFSSSRIFEKKVFGILEFLIGSNDNIISFRLYIIYSQYFEKNKRISLISFQKLRNIPLRMIYVQIKFYFYCILITFVYIVHEECTVLLELLNKIIYI